MNVALPFHTRVKTIRPHHNQTKVVIGCHYSLRCLFFGINVISERKA
jgi:hypothetical protein